MANSEGSPTTEKPVPTVKPVATEKPVPVAPATPEPPTPASADVEAQTSSSPTGVSGIVERWKRENLLKKGSLILRTLALLFSLLSFIIMASNKHGDSDGDWRNFDNYEEYKYCLAIAIISTLYTLGQILRQVQQFSTGKEMFSLRTTNLVDFFGDQIVAYLLISAASSAVPKTNELRLGADNIFTDSCAAAISMAFFAFFVLALCAMVSGFKLSNQTYI